MNFFPVHIQPFMNDSNSGNSNSQGFENSWIDMRGCVWVGESFNKIKLLGKFFPISIQPFTNDSNSGNNNS